MRFLSGHGYAQDLRRCIGASINRLHLLQHTGESRRIPSQVTDSDARRQGATGALAHRCSLTRTVSTVVRSRPNFAFSVYIVASAPLIHPSLIQPPSSPSPPLTVRARARGKRRLTVVQ